MVYDRIGKEVVQIDADETPLPVGSLVLPLEALTSDMVEVTGSKATNPALSINLWMRPDRLGFVVTADP